MLIDEKSSDARLIEAVNNGDSSAFGVIVRRYESVVAATVIGIMGPGDEAEEVGHETMIKLFRSLDRFKGEAELKTFLTRIAINASLDALRRRKRNLKRFFSPSTEEGAPSWEENIPSDADHGRDFENRQAVDFALAQLKPEFRAVAVLRLMQGFTVEESAEILRIPTGTVLSRLSRAKSQLADILRKELSGV